MCPSSLQFIYISHGFFHTEHQQNQPTCRLLSNDFSLVHQSLMQDEDSMVGAGTLFIPLTAVEPQQTSCTCTKYEKPAPNLLESASSIHPMYIVKRYTCRVAAFNNLVSPKILQLVAWNSRYGMRSSEFRWWAFHLNKIFPPPGGEILISRNPSTCRYPVGGLVPLIFAKKGDGTLDESETVRKDPLRRYDWYSFRSQTLSRVRGCDN